jgi:hypothetical protein
MPGVTGGPGTQNYTGVAIVAANRGRIDIVEGGIEPLFTKGDYLLFDSTDVIIVHPATRDFIPVGRESANRAMDRLSAMGATMTISDEKVKLDSLGAGDTISGVPTRRYRMTVAFNMAMDAGFMQQRLGTESVTEYWIATIAGLPPNPLLRSNGLSGSGMTGMFKTLAARVDSLSARMGHTIALRSTTATKVITGPGQVVETQQSSEVLDIQRRDVDQSLLILPVTYKAAAVPGLDEKAPPADNGTKWKAPPRGLP